MQMGPIWGIDLGGTKIEGVVIEDRETPNVLKRLRIPTEAHLGYHHVIDQISRLTEVLTAETGVKPGVIGMGTPGVLDPISRTMKNCNTTCLFIYPLPEWEKIEREIQELPGLNQAVKRFKRLVIGYATDLELDGNGRVLLPAPLRDYAQLEKKLVLVGQGKKLELWSEELWLAERDQALEESGPDAEVPEELMSLTL